MVKTSSYDSSRTNQGPLRRTLARWRQHNLGNVQPRKGNRRGINSNVDQHLEILLDSLTCTVSYKEDRCEAWKTPTRIVLIRTLKKKLSSFSLLSLPIARHHWREARGDLGAVEGRFHNQFVIKHLGMIFNSPFRPLSSKVSFKVFSKVGLSSGFFSI